MRNKMSLKKMKKIKKHMRKIKAVWKAERAPENEKWYVAQLIKCNKLILISGGNHKNIKYKIELEFFIKKIKFTSK